MRISAVFPKGVIDLPNRTETRDRFDESETDLRNSSKPFSSRVILCIFVNFCCFSDLLLKNVSYHTTHVSRVAASCLAPLRPAPLTASSPGNRTYCYSELAVSSLTVGETCRPAHSTYSRRMARVNQWYCKIFKVQGQGQGLEVRGQGQGLSSRTTTLFSYHLRSQLES